MANLNYPVSANLQIKLSGMCVGCVCARTYAPMHASLYTHIECIGFFGTMPIL